MSEPIGMSIKIGGTLPESLVKELVEEINDDIYDSNIDTKTDLLKCGTRGESAFKIYGMANYGECDDVKEFCRRNKLSYIHHCEASCEYNSSISFWTPDMKAESQAFSTQNADVMVDARNIRSLMDFVLAIIEMGEKALPLFLNEKYDGTVKDIAETALKNPKKLLSLLKKRVNKIIPVPPIMPPFKIIKGN